MVQVPRPYLKTVPVIKTMLRLIRYKLEKKKGEADGNA
jgi:hypothetical protein